MILSLLRWTFSDLGFDLVSWNSLIVLIKLRHQTNYKLQTVWNLKFSQYRVLRYLASILRNEATSIPKMLAGTVCDQPLWRHSQGNPIVEVKCLQGSFIMSQYGTRSEDWISGCCTIYLRLLSIRCHAFCPITSNVSFFAWSVLISGLQTLRRNVCVNILTRFKIRETPVN